MMVPAAPAAAPDLMIWFGIAWSVLLFLALLGNLFHLAGITTIKPTTPGHRVVSVLLSFAMLTWFWFAYFMGTC